MAVAENLASAFVLSLVRLGRDPWTANYKNNPPHNPLQPTALQWDTCGAHAILKALGGEVVSLASGEPLRYGQVASEAAAHANGLVAVRRPDVAEQIRRLLRK